MDAWRISLDISNFLFKYCVYYPVVLLRGEWVGKHLKALQKSQFYPIEKISEIQLDRLNKLLKHARKTVPHYAELPKQTLTTLEQLKNLPFLEKEFLRDHSEQLYSTKTGLFTRLKTTGGSTGAPVTLRKDNRGMAHELAATWRGYSWSGVDIGDRQARFWGVPASSKDKRRAKLIDFIAHRRRFSAFSFTSNELDSYVTELSNFKPDYFYGYVSMIRQFADHVEKTGQSELVVPKAIITTAEALTEPDRRKIEDVFNCRVFDEYGCGEIGTIAHECEFGVLHLSVENMVVEILKEDGRPVGPGEEGEIVVTDLVNYSMPLIRYRLKDYATLSDETCRCGRELPTIRNVLGREYDILVNTKGEKFHGEFFIYIFEDLKKSGFSVESFQIVQSKDLNITISIKCLSENYGQIIAQVKKELCERFDENLKYSFLRVDKVCRESSGKLRIVKRNFE